MQLELFFIITFIAAIGLIGIGFLIGRLSKNDKAIYFNDNTNNLRKYNTATHKLEKINGEPLPEQFYDDTNTDIKPGIVYRPTVEEIEKMNEPQKVKEEKEAMAEIFRQETPPEI